MEGVGRPRIPVQEAGEDRGGIGLAAVKPNRAAADEEEEKQGPQALPGVTGYSSLKGRTAALFKGSQT